MINVSLRKQLLLPSWTVMEILEMIARLYGFSKEEAAQRKNEGYTKPRDKVTVWRTVKHPNEELC